MFKLESYITPILLSYVDRYINNFKPEDFQVSLWGGEACFLNLELNLQVLEQELQLPFSFVSGSIRELIIQIPWTKLASEPIVVTINTIECILNLKGKDSSRTDVVVQKKAYHGKDVEAPPGYVQLLINKIVNNIRIYCNNVILKYVEEDIVLSMNIKHLKFESANEKWEPAYIDLSPAQVVLRKVITVNDLTLCLDKRNASGKIEVYQEPMLYRCSMTMHLLKNYHSATASKASITRLDILCNNMEFSMTEQQVPMLYRLMMLLYALQQRQLKPERGSTTDSGNIPSDARDNMEKQESWSGWAWSYVSSVLPTPWEEDLTNEEFEGLSGHTLHFGFYLDNLSITFKVSELSSERGGIYGHKKMRYNPMLALQLQGIYCETVIHGMRWLNATGGVSQALLVPIGQCSCSFIEGNEDSPNPYLKLGNPTNSHKTDSLFDAEAVENKGQRRQYVTSWDEHMAMNTESVLLERTPAVSFDYVYQIEVPSDMSSEILSELESDHEYSNLSESASMRICLGPFKLILCSGLFHRISTLYVAASYYDYQPYFVAKTELSLHELLPPSAEDFDALNEFIPSRNMRITFFAPTIELQLMDHPYFQPTKGQLFRKRKKTTSPPPSSQPTPKLTIECQFLDISMDNPMYVNRVVYTTCQLPDPPQKMFDACFKWLNIKVAGLCSRLILGPEQHTTIVTPSTLSYSCKTILKPQYWTNPDIPHVEMTFESESVTVNGTNAKMMVIAYIIGKMIRMDSEGCSRMMNNTSLLRDATNNSSLPYMEVCIEGIRFRKVVTNATTSIDVNLGSIKAFIFEPVDIKPTSNKDNVQNHGGTRDFGGNFVTRDIQQVLFVSGPEPKHIRNTGPVENLPLFSATLQYPLTPDVQKHPPILLFNLQEIRICVDPLLCRWLLYKPRQTASSDTPNLLAHKSKSLSEASGSLVETPRRISSQIESVHSSSDREPIQLPQKIEIPNREDGVDMQERIYNILKTWFEVWKGMFLYGDISQCTIYFPLKSLSAIGSQGIQEAVEEAVNKDHPPDIMVITLPFANVRSAHRQNISKHLKSLPVRLPDNIWLADKSSFPWTMSISELSCYTIQYGNKLIFLKPVSLSATVGLSTRPTKDSSDTLPGSPAKTDIGYLGICVHIDMTPIVISTSEVQVYLFASILYGLMEVATNLLPEKPKAVPKTPDVIPPIVTKGSSTLSPTVLRENTLDSESEKTPPISSVAQENIDTESVKLTAWVQWTITRFTVELLSSEYLKSVEDEPESLQPRLKLVVDAEDIVSSLDFQSVYLKIKSKIGSMSILHFKRTTPNSKWKPGPFSGIVMRLREDIPTGQRHEDNGFISLTITRASCRHTHTLWGAVQKRNKDKKLSAANQQLLSQSRYITEIVVNVQPIDFVISLQTLRSFYLVLMPLLQIPLREDNAPKNVTSNAVGLNNQTLPLAYLDCQDIRIVMPSVELGGSDVLHDVVIFQVQKICLSPTAVNPICRTPLRPDIYEQAAHARILHIPGSEVEDRQYQLDLNGMIVCTGVWKDLDLVFTPSSGVTSNLRGTSENPALEWNNLEQGQPNMTPTLNLWHVTEKFDISIVAAPAMVYKDTTIICGHSVEINFVTDIVVNLSLQQIKLLSALLSEFVLLVEPLVVDESLMKRPKLQFPYSIDAVHYKVEEKVETLVTVEILRDSGIDMSDMKSVFSSKVQGTVSTVKTIVENDKPVFPRPPNPLPQAYSAVPIEALFTAGKIAVALYETDMTKTISSRHKARKKKSKIKLDEDLGYEAEEEGVDDKSDKKYIPLVYLCINQPNAFLSKHQTGRRIQISCFNLNLRLNGPEYMPIGHVPTEDDFPINLLETRSGIPHPNTGILPAFFTLKYSKGIGKNATLDVDISKPTKILCSSSKWGYLLTIKDKVMDTFKGTQRNLVVVSKNIVKATTPVPIPTYTRTKIGDTYTKFQEIKDLLHGTNSVNLRFNQIILSVKSDTGHEVNLGIERLKSHLTLSSRPEKLSNTLKLESITLSVINDEFKKLLLNPWTLSFELCLFWESWQSVDSEPQIQITAESDCIILDVSPEQIKCVEIVTKDITEFISTLPLKETPDDDVTFEIPRLKPLEKDQHYKDDLRAGAFQFIDSNSENADELPLPYQVMFWNRSISAMAWRYPQPRALTKVRVFPVPYKMTLGAQDDLLVLCHLEYWSECRNRYLPFTQFYLSESEVCHLTLPDGSPQPAVASIWRVVITMVTEKEDVPDSTLISPRALAACMRIDSYFNKSLVPNITAALYITKIDVSLYSHFNKHLQSKLPGCLKNYTSDLQFPESQKFLTLTWDNLTAYLSSWDFEVMSGELNCTTKCSVLDYSFLTEQILVEPFTSKLEVNLADNLHCKFISRPVILKFNPTIAHTLAVSSQQWAQTYKTDVGEQDFIIMTRYVICNNTNINIRFGQTGTDEDILLPPNHFNLYAWRSQKKKQLVKVALEENDWSWSKSFQISEDGTQTIQFNSEKHMVMLVSVKSLSATQKLVTVSGQLTVTNMLTEHFELKVMQVKNNKEAEFKSSPTYIVPGKSSTLSIFTNTKKTYIMRLRFYGLESAWTGDIPLREHATGSQPWLVKVPLQERGQFLSIWCRIMIQEVQKVKRTLAVLWPLFTVKSNLPMNAQVHIETPTLNVRLDAVVKGKGELQQLYCPGTIDHSHQLTFKLDKSNSLANPYVPLNYSLINHQKFFKKSEKQDIDEILSVLNEFSESKWPYFGDELDNVEWVVDDQPLTHVQVRYQNACLHSCSLLVELIPWCLMVNTLGTSVAVMLGGIELCRLQHHGIVAPPKLEENFNLAVYTGGCWCVSGPLQLAKSDWSQTFYMPTITGTVPLEGSIKTTVRGEAHVCMVALSSTVANEIRLLRVSSTHVVSNHMTMQMQVICLAVPEGDKVYEIPRNVEQYSFTVAPHLHKSNSGVPIIQWQTIKNSSNCDCNTEYVLYMAFCFKPELGWSCPIRVDKPLLRKSFCVAGDEHPVPLVLTSQEYKGQIFLAVHNDNRPQMFIENKTRATLFCAQSLGENKVETEAQHFKWHCRVGSFSSVYYTMPFLSEKFPELPQNNFSEKIALACDPESDENEFQWSTGISIIHDNEQFVRIPYYGDIRLTIINSACTTFLILDSVSQVEISARDIRVRLSMHENEGSSRAITESKDANIDLSRSLSDTSVAGTSKSPFQKLPTVAEQFQMNSLTVSKTVRRWSDSKTTHVTSSAPRTLLVNTLPMKDKWKSVKFDVYVRSFAVILTTDVEEGGTERWELANMVCDNLVLSASQTENMKVNMSISDVQFDNQLYSKESFDFPVVLVGQEDDKPKKKLSSLSVPIEHLMENAEDNALVVIDIVLETWRDRSRSEDITGIKDIKIMINPLSCYVEDIYITLLMEYLAVFVPTNLVTWPELKTHRFYSTSGLVSVPELISWQCAILARPLTIRNFSISPLSLLLSVHSSIKVYIALDQSSLLFGKFERRRLFTTPYRVGHALTMHYLSGAIFGAGWVVSSLELLGSPGGLARAMGTGLRDFVSLPYRGLLIGPMAFLRGVTQGSASLMKHVTAGTLQSVTKLASSVARNLDRLTLDEEHLRRTEEQRRQRPQGLAQGFLQGLTGLGISLLGAVGGIAHHPLQSVITDGASPRSLAAGVGLGLVGVVTKPLSGAAELVALTGQGLLQGAGWNSLPTQRSAPTVQKIQQGENSGLKFSWKLVNCLTHSQMLYVTEATSITNQSEYNALTLILTVDVLIIINTDEDSTERIISLSELTVVDNKDPTMLEFKLTPPLVHIKSEDETVIEMDPASRARVADYVRNTVGILNLPVVQSDHSDISISPLSSPGIIPDVSVESTVLTFYVNPQSKNYFLRLLAMAKQHRHNYNFPVL